MTDERFEQALACLVLGGDAPARLLGLSEHSAVLVLGNRSYALVFRHLPGTEEGLGEHLLKVTSGLKAGTLHLVLIGGQSEEHERLLTRAQIGWGINRRVGVMQLKDDGGLWIGPRTRPDGKLAGALRRFAEQGPAEPRPDLRERLCAVVDPNADGSRDLAAFARRLRRIRPLASWALLGACSLLFLLSGLWGGSEYVPTLMRMGANAPQLVAGGDFHRLASSVFLHAGLAHLVMNMLGLVVLGTFIERLLGPCRLLILFCLSGLAGSLASALLGGEALSVGASGALWGLFGASAVLAFLPLVEIPAPVLIQLRRSTLLILAINLAISFLPRIDLWAHLGGGLMGAALVGTRLLAGGPDLRRFGADHGEMRRPAWLLPAAVLVAATMLAGCLWAVADGRPWELVGRPGWRRVGLEHTGVSLEVPSLIADRQRQADDGDRRELALGDLGIDPLMVVVSLGPGPQDIAGPERLAAEFEALKNARRSQQVDGATRSGSARERAFDGVPTMEELFVYPSGVRLWRFSQLRPGRVITVTILVWPDGPQIWAEQVERIIESLRTDTSASA